MSSNGGRRSFKIVAPEEQNREQELIGGLKNAILRGESIQKAKQSFINAGYKPQEIEKASQKISTTSKTNQQLPSQSPNPNQTNQQPSGKPQSIKQPKPLSKKFLIILILISIIIIAGAAVLGLLWDKILK